MNESVADILREMREIAKENSFKDLLEWCDRIEGAYNRLAIPTPEQWTEFARQGSENERLREALKPVLAVHLCDGGQQVVSDALCAIREAKKIMKGEAK